MPSGKQFSGLAKKIQNMKLNAWHSVFILIYSTIYSFSRASAEPMNLGDMIFYNSFIMVQLSYGYEQTAAVTEFKPIFDQDEQLFIFG